MIQREDLLKLGFNDILHFTVTDALVYNLGRRRYISIGCLNTPNEMVFICQNSLQDIKIVEDLICIHNYDYDGYLTIEKIKGLIQFLSPVSKEGGRGD